MNIIIFISFLFICSIESKHSVDVEAAKLFVIPLHYTNFSAEQNVLQYSASILGLPDLPTWMHTTHSHSMKMGFLFGVPPPEQSDIQIEVIALNKLTYETNRHVIKLNISPNSSHKFNVVLKVSNLNIDELLIGSRYLNLLRVVADDLWQEQGHMESDDEINMLSTRRQKRVGHDLSSLGRADLKLEDFERGARGHKLDVVVTGIVRATHLGDRVPLLPHHKEGVYVSFGSNKPFSSALLRLESEVSILYNRAPCPTYFKKTSYERYFRSKNFAIDWCSFRMYEINDTLSDTPFTRWSPQIHRRRGNLTPLTEVISGHLQGIMPLVERDQIPFHNYTSDVIETILVPIAVLFLLVTLLTLAMCCNTQPTGNSATAFLDELIEGFPSKNMMHDLRSSSTPHHHQPVVTSSATNVTRGGSQARSVQRHHHSLEALDTSRQYQSDTDNVFDDNGYDTGDFDNSVVGDECDCSDTYNPSPDLSLGRHSNRFEDYATLTRPAPPPYNRECSTPQFEE